MSQLPEITQTIAKSLLTEGKLDNAEDTVVNTVLTQVKPKKIQIEEKTSEIMKKELMDANSAEGEQSKKQFMRYQKQKLKLIYPNFVEKAIEAAALSAWDNITLQEKQAYISSCLEDIQKIQDSVPKRQEFGDLQSLEKQKKQQVLEEERQGNLEMKIQQQTNQLENCRLLSVNQVAQQREQEPVNSNSDSNASNDVSTNLPLKNDQSQNEVTVQKYILIQCKQTIDQPHMKQYSAIIVSQKDPNVDINDPKNQLQVLLTKIEAQPKDLSLENNENKSDSKENNKQETKVEIFSQPVSQPVPQNEQNVSQSAQPSIEQ